MSGLAVMSKSAFTAVAFDLHKNGYSPLPIAPGQKYPGKWAGLKLGWVALAGWNEWCTTHPSIHKVGAWSRMTNQHGGNVGVACGRGLICVDIDQDDLVEPLLALLPQTPVQKKGRKGVSLFYRGNTEVIRSKNYRTPNPNSVGLVDLLAEGKRTVLPPSIHPDTGEPYVWLNSRTLANTSIDDLPEIAIEHIAAMENTLRESGWNSGEESRSQAKHHSSQVLFPEAIHRDGDELDLLATRERASWLPKLGLHGLHRVPGGWRAVASFRPSGNGQTLEKRGHSLSIRDEGAIKDHGGLGYNNITLVAECLFGRNRAEAVGWLRAELGLHAQPTLRSASTSNSSASAVLPTYRDQRVTLPEAEERLRLITGKNLENDIREGIAACNRMRLKAPLILPVHPVTVLRSEAGTGKSHTTGQNIAKQTLLGRRFVYAVPNHRLAAQIATDTRERGVTAEVYRAFDKPDPLAPFYKMCRRPDAYKAARELSVGARHAVCERLIDDRIVRCPHANDCGMERQRHARPSQWIVPAALLFTKRPDFIPEFDALVVDESFIDSAIGDTCTVDIAALLQSKIEGCSDAEHEAVMSYRARLQSAITTNGDGPLRRDLLLEHGIDAEDAYWIGWLEQRRIDPKILRPDMAPILMSSTVDRHAPRNARARAAGTLWHEIATFLEEGKAADFYGERSLSGRITVAGRTMLVTPLRTVHPSWREAPTLILDATAPPASLVAITLGEIEIKGWAPVVTEQPDIFALWPDHVHVRQIVEAPVSMGKLGVWRPKTKDKTTPPTESKPRNVRDIVRFIRLRAALAAPRRIGVVSYKGLIQRISADLPGNVDLLWFGALSGLNSMKEVAGLIVIGRPSPPPSAIEAQAAVFAGHPIDAVGDFYPTRPGGIRLADGSGFPVKVAYHPNPIADALAWRVTVGELLQAIGRLRPHRRADPCWLDILCDVPLPITVQSVERWSVVSPGAEADMAAIGVILRNSRDSMSAYSLTKWEAENIGGCPGFSIDDLYRDSGATSEIYKVTYQKAGSGKKPNNAIYLSGVLPGGLAALRSWLETKLGPLASLQIAAGSKDGDATCDVSFDCAEPQV